MTTAVVTDAPLLAGFYTEWRLLSEQPSNVLLEGPDPATDAVLRLLERDIREPIVRHRPPATLVLPGRETRALILMDAAVLSRDEQRRLLAWMGDTGSSAQILTTASRPLFALVEAGMFDPVLYYRLNVLLLRITSPFQS
jgi:sigma-54-interacting transcriptional regulator